MQFSVFLLKEKGKGGGGEEALVHSGILAFQAFFCDKTKWIMYYQQPDPLSFRNQFLLHSTV